MNSIISGMYYYLYCFDNVNYCMFIFCSDNRQNKLVDLNLVDNGNKLFFLAGRNSILSLKGVKVLALARVLGEAGHE